MQGLRPPDSGEHLSKICASHYALDRQALCNGHASAESRKESRSESRSDQSKQKEQGQMKWEVGQKVFIVGGFYGRKPYFSEGIITKIGRKWAYLDGWRKKSFNMETGWIDGGQYTSPGRVYSSQSEYEKEEGLREAWQKLSYQLNHCPQPESITHEKIKQIRELLELPEPKEA
jgi:hypothetical protein